MTRRKIVLGGFIISVLILVGVVLIPPFIENITSPDAYDPGPTIFRSYLGGNFNDEIIEVGTDNIGNVIIVGFSDSEEYPLVSPSNRNKGLTDVFIAKISPEGSLIYFELFGGDSQDIPSDAVIDSDGKVFIIGSTSSPDLPTTSDAYQSHLRSSANDTFIAIFSPTGVLEYCSYFGGSGDEHGYGIALDTSGEIMLVGTTSSYDFPLVNASDSTMAGSEDLYLARLDSTLTNLTYSTYWGSYEVDVIADQSNPIVIGEDGRIFIAASTRSLDYPIHRAPRNQSLDAFIACFNESGYLISSHFVNASCLDDEDDFISSINIGPDGMLYSLGTVYERVGRAINGSDVYAFLDGKIMLSKLDQDFSGNESTTYIDGYHNDTATDMRINGTGFLFITGQTESLNFPEKNSIEQYSGGIDSFLTILDSSNFSIIFSSWLGGADNELRTKLGLDPEGRVILAGTTNSIDLIPVNSFQSSKADYGYRYDAYIWSIDLSAVQSKTTSTSTSIPPSVIINEDSIIIISILVTPSLLAIVVLFVISRRIRTKES